MVLNELQLEVGRLQLRRGYSSKSKLKLKLKFEFAVEFDPAAFRYM